jgi:chemotaxis protein histidine kinase CheA
MIHAIRTSAPGPLPLGDRLLELAELIQAALAPGSRPDQLAAVRRSVQDVQAETETRGMEPRARALARIGLLTEVWECLSADQPDSAGDVGFFCAKAASQLARSERLGDGGEEVAGWVLDESSSLWGEYLDLLETPSPPGSEDPLPPEEPTDLDSSPAIDTQALLRLFTGFTGGGPPESKEPDPAVGAPGSSPACGRHPPVPRPTATAAVEPVARTIAPAPRARPGIPPPVLKIPPLPPRIDLDEEIREAFLADVTDLFERIEPLVLGLHRAADQGGTLLELGRCFHTLKGAAGSVGLADLASLVHALEEHLKEAGSHASAALNDLLHEILGYLDGLLTWLRTGAAKGAGDERSAGDAADRPVIDDSPSARDPARDPAAMPAPEAALPPPGQESSTTTTPPSTASPPSSTAAEGPVRIPASRFDELMDLVSELISRRRLWAGQAESMKPIAAMVRTCRNRMLGTLDRLHEAGLGRDQRTLVLEPRADVPGQLRRLAEQADDLAVLAETAQAAAVPMADHGDALGRLTIQLWDELQAIRVVAIQGLFQRLIRVAHDAARVEERQVEVVTFGDETGVDRAVQDKAFEPLLHVVRNAVGHGIEPPADRLKASKAATGRITLEARREGNTLVISVQDDGRGLNHEAIAAKARRLGLLAPDERPSIERLNNLIFHSGFSTKQEVSAISGRGVGMDVVAREVGLLKGTIDLQTEPGRGTRLTIRLPARLALETAMIFRVDGQAFALPVAQIEYAQPYEPEPESESEPAGPSGREEASGRRGDSISFRDRRIAVIRAREMLGIATTPAPECPKLLVVRAGTGLIGLVVDAIEGTEELVIKSLGALLAGHPVISGTSQSVGGEVISILNLSTLGRRINEGASTAPFGLAPRAGHERPLPGPAVLVVDDSISVRRVAARQLRALGLEVDEVSDGLEALGRLRSRRYGLVVTDLEMPRLDGFELVAEMQRTTSLAAIPVIVASTRADPETRERVLALGARAFLAKPVDPGTLAGALGPLLERVGV